MTSKAMDAFINVSEHPYLTVPQYVIWDAVITLAHQGNKLVALRLLRGAYFSNEEGWASLTDALAMYALISGASTWADVPGLLKAFNEQTDNSPASDEQARRGGDCPLDEARRGQKG